MGNLIHDNSNIQARIDLLESLLNENYVCPISQTTFIDPVIADDCQTYDRINIENWLKVSNNSPITNEILKSKELRPNFFVKEQIEDLISKIAELKQHLK